MSPTEFDAIVAGVIAELPADLQEVLQTCAIIIDDWADDEVRELLGDVPIEETPYGYYDGVPYGERNPSDGSPLLPDRIFLFRGPLIEDFSDPDELADEIRVTLVHELGHMIGFDEDDLEARGLE